MRVSKNEEKGIKKSKDRFATVKKGKLKGREVEKRSEGAEKNKV